MEALKSELVNNRSERGHMRSVFKNLKEAIRLQQEQDAQIISYLQDKASERIKRETVYNWSNAVLEQKVKRTVSKRNSQTLKQCFIALEVSMQH